jgi:hypothetical protein
VLRTSDLHNQLGLEIPKPTTYAIYNALIKKWGKTASYIRNGIGRRVIDGPLRKCFNVKSGTTSLLCIRPKFLNIFEQCSDQRMVKLVLITQ